jgi:hypothetical protein
VLADIIHDLRREIPGGSKVSAYSMIDEMLAHGVARQLRVEFPPGTNPVRPPPARAFYLLEFGSTAETEVHPLELLLADRPDGILCYWSALAYYDLSTQPVAHHHVATRVEPSATTRQGDRTPAAPSAGRLHPHNPLGELAFHYEGIPYYRTRRSAGTNLGFRLKYFAPRCLLRITTLEQTLLDTLHNPRSCGGPAVILEAWREALSQPVFDEDRFEEYIGQLGKPALARRLGAMLDILGHCPSAGLRETLTLLSGEMSDDPVTTLVALLPGFPYHRIDPRWNVGIP